VNRGGDVSPERVELLRKMYLAGTLRSHINHLLRCDLDDEGDNRTIGTRRTDPALDNRNVGQNWPR